MTERIDHAAEAMNCVEYANSPKPGSPEVAANIMAQAAVHATLALVEQQRIANLLRVQESLSSNGNYELASELWSEQIKEALLDYE